MRRLALVVIIASLGCQYDFGSICRTGEICDERELPPRVVVREPSVGQVAGCEVFTGRCGTTSSSCGYVLRDGMLVAPPACVDGSGAGTGSGCSDADDCSLGYACVVQGGRGRCTDVCRVQADCRLSTDTCDRSRTLAVLDGVSVHRCIDLR